MILAFVCQVFAAEVLYGQAGPRRNISLNENWLTIAQDEQIVKPAQFSYMLPPVSSEWKKVNVPHNWDAYHGYRRLVHGNLHGNSWYRKSFRLTEPGKEKRIFLFFEGVGSYATVYLNGQYAGEHAGGRTSFTLDVTGLVKTNGSENQLSVRAYHPSNIKDLPWVCGGCSDERGFSEGSQPMGIFRPVHLIVTNSARITPFGVHAWANISDQRTELFIKTSVKNYSATSRSIDLENQLRDRNGKLVASGTTRHVMNGNDSATFDAKLDLSTTGLKPWSTTDPYLYQIISIVKQGGRVIDQTVTEFGFRTINWRTNTNQFHLNGQPVFINGVAEYEHLLGQSHAFSQEQVQARMKWIRLAGFNGFRDGHQPHNLLYGQLCNRLGILWWTQISAHIWYDSPEFRNNFKTLLREWVIERRNDPSVVLWGLQNESKLPEDFARECTELIRSLDPTTSSQRLVTTCNGGFGTDWDVPQNWTGTYGGNPDLYASDVKKQVLIGEYGAWRTIDLHTEGPYVQNGVLSEDRMTLLMEQKVRLAESVKDSSAGQFFWLLTSHDNPGRVQGGEGLRELDRIGPVNYKGLLTPWEEPLDVYYMFRSNYADNGKDPMVYIVSHTWPSRWKEPGIRDSILVYSNCDEVELFNDIENKSLGRRRRNGIGTHFQWDKASINYNVLYAVGYVNGKAVARDTVVQNHLPVAPGFNKLYANSNAILAPAPGYHYIYRLNCGGPDYKDTQGNTWYADKVGETGHIGQTSQIGQTGQIGHNGHIGQSGQSKQSNHSNHINHKNHSTNWTDRFEGMPAFFASQRRTFAPIKGTRDWKLFQEFRYGKDELKFEFAVPDGEYLVELFFVEPWIGIGGGDGKGLRIFDVAINGKTVINDLDIWKEKGTNRVLKKTVKAAVKGSRLVVSFPESKVGQAILSAIAIASKKELPEPSSSASIFQNLEGAQANSWLDIGNLLYTDRNVAAFSLPPNLYGAEWLQSSAGAAGKISFRLNKDADVFIAVDGNTATQRPGWLSDFENTITELVTDQPNGTYPVFRKRFSADAHVSLSENAIRLIAALPVTSIQPAYDLKATVSYRANQANTIRNVSKDTVQGRLSAIVRSNDMAEVQWPIQTGVADIYAITMKYYYPFENEVKGKLKLLGPGNALMLEEEVSFTFTRPTKWNQFTINTGNMINAGNYIVQLEIEGANNLAISGIEVQ